MEFKSPIVLKGLIYRQLLYQVMSQKFDKEGTSVRGFFEMETTHHLGSIIRPPLVVLHRAPSHVVRRVNEVPHIRKQLRKSKIINSLSYHIRQA